MRSSTPDAAVAESPDKLGSAHHSSCAPSEEGRKKVDRDSLLDHPAVAAWRRLARAPLEPHQIDVLKEKNKSVVYRLHGICPAGQSIVAKKTLSESARIERMVYEDLLPSIAVPSLQLHGFVDEGEYCWLFLEDAQGEEYRPGDEEHRALAGQWLGALHSRVTSNVRALPDRGPKHYRMLLHSAREILREHLTNPVLLSRDVTMLRLIIEQYDRIESHWEEMEQISAALPPTLVHGDFVVKNVRVQVRQTGPRLLVFDWENAGFGVPAVDFTQFTGRTVSPDLLAYNSVNPLPGLSANAPTLERIADWGRILRLLESIRWTTTKLFFKPYDWLITAISSLEIYQTRLTSALGAMKWKI
jgi:Phosphotransferase enzyme family